MSQFRILGVHASGEVESLVVDAPDAAAARLDGVRRGVAVISITPMRRRTARRDVASGRAGRLDVSLFCQELLALLSAGITVGEALDTLSRNDERSGSAHAARVLLEAVQEGRPLSAAMAAQPTLFPRLLTESIRASERTSDYVPALTRFIRYRRLGSELRTKAVSAALYPMILLAVSGAVLLFLLGYVVPRFAQVYAEMGDRLPPASRLFLALGQAISDHPQLMVAVLVAALAALAIAVRSQRARDSAFSALQRIPSVRRILEAAQFARMYRTLALLVHGGIPLVSAMRIVRGLLSPEIAPRLDAALQAVSEGNSFSGAMRREGLATVIADRFMRVGEQTGRLGDMLDRAAEFHEDELGRLADRVGRVLGPVMMLLMGALIGFVVVMMYLPIFQLAEAVG